MVLNALEQRLQVGLLVQRQVLLLVVVEELRLDRLHELRQVLGGANGAAGG